MKVLITGGTGSLGTQLVQHFLATGAEKVIVYSRDEVKQGDLAKQFPDPRLRCFLGDVRDYWRLLDALWGVDTIVHTAALKRVDQVSYNPSEVLKTNVLGTQNVLHAALEMDVDRVLLISSDKAVHPINVYGASKQMAEFLTVRYNVYGAPRGLRTSVLRYGNVWGSRGSVQEAWREQAKTGVLNVTDPATTRFLITLPAAVSCVQQALDTMQGGEIFVPKLPAWKLTQLAALYPGTTTRIVGRRPGGEKLHEQLISDEECTRVVDEGRFYTIVPEPHEWTASSPWLTAPRIFPSGYTSQTAPPVMSEQLKELRHAT